MACWMLRATGYRRQLKAQDYRRHLKARAAQSKAIESLWHACRSNTPPSAIHHPQPHYVHTRNCSLLVHFNAFQCIPSHFQPVPYPALPALHFPRCTSRAALPALHFPRCTSRAAFPSRVSVTSGHHTAQPPPCSTSLTPPRLTIRALAVSAAQHANHAPWRVRIHGPFHPILTGARQ